MKKQHAIHNEKACDYLLLSNNFNDWVVTTAFYSALHYVQHELFPLKQQNTVYKDFNTLFYRVLKRNNSALNKHYATIRLVAQYLPTCNSHYRWLHDACKNARYSNYRVSERKAHTARAKLDQLKNHLAK